jgi:hypothetical protein
MPFSAQNPKHEARNPKQYQMTEMGIFKTRVRSSSGFGGPAFRQLGFRICGASHPADFAVRHSDFEFLNISVSVYITNIYIP